MDDVHDGRLVALQRPIGTPHIPTDGDSLRDGRLSKKGHRLILEILDFGEIRPRVRGVPSDGEEFCSSGRLLLIRAKIARAALVSIDFLPGAGRVLSPPSNLVFITLKSGYLVWEPFQILVQNIAIPRR